MDYRLYRDAELHPLDYSKDQLEDLSDQHDYANRRMLEEDLGAPVKLTRKPFDVVAFHAKLLATSIAKEAYDYEHQNDVSCRVYRTV